MKGGARHGVEIGPEQQILVKKLRNQCKVAAGAEACEQRCEDRD